MDDIILNDLPLTIPFRVFDETTGHYIFSILSANESGDVPPDVALLPVVGLRAVDGVLYVDVRT